MTTSLSLARWWLAFLYLLTICSSNGNSQEEDEDELPEFLPGLVADVDLLLFGQVKRIDQDVSFDWNEASVDHRADSKSPINVRWAGFLECKENGQFKIHVFAAGRFTVRIDDRQVLEGASKAPIWFDAAAMELKFGRHPIEIEYEGSGSKRQIGLYWSGPGFELEPISQRYFSHRSEALVDQSFETGEQLSRAFRCAACHSGRDVRKSLTAPALTHLDGNLHRGWLVERLTATRRDAGQRMPHFGLDRADAEAIASTLFDASERSTEPKKYAKPSPVKGKKDDPPPRTEPSVAAGRKLFVSRGCLACHQLGELGERSLFDGGDLSAVASKRTEDFLARWLEGPSKVNSDHRMPVFELEPLERADLVLFLRSLSEAERKSDQVAKPNRDVIVRGKELIAEHRCGACHQLPTALRADVKRTEIVAASDWENGCLQASDAKSKRPGFGLTQTDRDALKMFWTSVEPTAIAKLDGHQVMIEHNCVACHARDAATGLGKILAKLAKVEPEIAPQLSALSPPSLTGVGDKLKDQAIADVLAGRDPRRRPWLDVRMPKFRLSEEESRTIIHQIVGHDRIPERKLKGPELPTGKLVELAGARLVTAEGFGCQSCHKIGSAEPPKVAINAHGTDLTMLGERVRPSWFNRWVHNPARIVPRMEMPAIQVAAKGVLNDDLELQLAALWKTLNTPGFEPPKPNPVRIVRNFNAAELREHANVLTDVLETHHGNFLRPLIIGLPNRHNVLFDLEKGQLSNWWVGDTARQHTRGKSWYWEAGAPSIVEGLTILERFSVVDASNRVWKPQTLGQFVVQFDGLQHIDGGIEWRGRVELRHDGQPRFVSLVQRVVAEGGTGVLITTTVRGIEATEQIVIETEPGMQLLEKTGTVTVELNENTTAVWSSPLELRVLEKQQMRLSATDSSRAWQWMMKLSTNLPQDRLQPLSVPSAIAERVQLNVVPGYLGIQLPLPRNEMPTALAWRDSGEMFVASLKGRVLRVADVNADGFGDAYEVLSDDLPAPYGLAANAESVDVLCKTSLIRLTPNSELPNAPLSETVVADGWGYTADYHDWAVGLERDADGSYYMALPCQQDDRGPAAANMRGQALKLIPYQSAESPRAYRIESMAAGLRFPMGLALSRDGDLFATDNQGNYNPFNELNHLQFGKRYGFINKLEAKPGFSPPFESPAVNLPHPWTRSVNGLCFLNTPAKLAASGKRDVFGPFEGDLIGCEYNGLSLIRMSLQKVDGQYQGAAYMFSRTPAAGEATFEGPVCCAVSPSGELYVGSIHDSGWGGGQNTGSIVRLRMDRELPLGIDEVRATATGFEISFTQPVDAERASQAVNYSIRSYRRISTPAYGGDDQDDRSEPIRRLKISDDLRTVNLELNELRAGCVYEINVGSIGVGEEAIFPSQAHYNMRAVPNGAISR